MEIRDRKTISAGPAPAAKRSAQQAAAHAASAAAPRDVFEVAGIPAAELTPNVQRALTALMAEVDQLRRELQEARNRIGHLEKLVDEDPLMPVVNRRAFVRELTRMMAFAQRYGVPASIVYFDVNNLKQVNDNFGHAAGDAALVQLAKIMVENIRTTDVVGRLGGDELGVLLVQTDLALAERKAAELAAAAAARPLDWQGHRIQLGLAYGVHVLGGTESPGAAIEAADRAMYSAKKHIKAAAPG